MRGCHILGVVYVIGSNQGISEIPGVLDKWIPYVKWPVLHTANESRMQNPVFCTRQMNPVCETPCFTHGKWIPYVKPRVLHTAPAKMKLRAIQHFCTPTVIQIIHCFLLRVRQCRQNCARHRNTGNRQYSYNANNNVKFRRIEYLCSLF